MTTYHWNDIYSRGVELFHEPPGKQIEQEMIQAFQRNPGRVKAEMEKLGTQITAGAPIRSGWAILRKRLESNADDVVATDTGELERRIIQARRWLHNAGCHFDLERDVEDELFGNQGILADHDSPQLRSEILEAWRQERPRGKRAEEAHEAYMVKIVADRKRLETGRSEA